MNGLFLRMVFEKTLNEVVDENYVYARALHYLGIDFFENPHRKLKDICRERSLDRQKVIKSFYLFDSNQRISFPELESYPIELLMEYLKHAHHVFIKEKLPFIVHLARKWNREEGLKNLLPEFIEDFIRHIYEEEDSTFRYIDLLCKQSDGSATACFKLMSEFKEYSLISEFEEHQDEDEFGAIRALMDNVQPVTLHDRVLLSEIRAFDREMIYHAEIENNIFFPKALALEEQSQKRIKTLSTLN
ncbi:MAG: iron-sulfur cluster repair di-iron protein [Ekhidna sp.]|uniref:iron-sulfur cluster repair di-iron protein n=2 Tax=Ekhidna sp. TaxID=2608089 RepID=UPI0032967ED5